MSKETSPSLFPGGNGPAPTIWGLSAEQLHEAYWRAHGIQCVRRGRQESLQAAAELFLLIEPDQLVLFDLRELADRLTWRAAALTRLRIVDEEHRSYGEHVVMDERGLVKRIARRYRPRSNGAYRVILTRQRRIARIWMSAGTRRDRWSRIRRAAGLSHIDNLRCTGCCFTASKAAQEACLISRLVELWPNPAQAINGVDEVGEGVWSLRGSALGPEAMVIGPAWLGDEENAEVARCLIGPIWTPDTKKASHGREVTARLRDIAEIEPGDEHRNLAPPRHARLSYALAKRSLDLVVAGLGIVVGLPIFALIALCILLDDGRPIFYGHIRQTRGGRPFRCWKFRTMRRNADAMKRDFANQNVCDGPQFHIDNDPRLTRAGRFLRRYQLDELPQLWNVFVGQMSLVGPRPSPDDENQFSPTWREVRLSVRPGITGLWQLERTRQRGLDFQEWIRYDIEYVRRANFWFDLKLLARTLRIVLFRRRTHARHEAR